MRVDGCEEWLRNEEGGFVMRWYLGCFGAIESR